MNARDAMPVGGTIKIATGNVNRDKKICKASSAGCAWAPCHALSPTRGMASTNTLLPKIFEPFFTIKEFGKGTGLVLRRYTGL